MIDPLDHPDMFRLRPGPLYPVAASDHPLLHRAKIEPAMLAAEQIILGNKQEWE